MSRRQALAICGAGVASPLLLNPTQTLIRAIVDGFIQNADAQTASTPPRAVVNYHLGGAPIRWFWDLPMSPYANLTPAATSHMINVISNGQGQYRTHSFNTQNGTIHMPYLWASNIATPSGSTPMTALLQNMLMIRGAKGFSRNQHPHGAMEMTRPVGSRPSVMGFAADASNKPVQAILAGESWGVLSSFKSNASSQIQVKNMSSPMNEIIGPFNRANDGLSSSFISRRDAMDSIVRQALSQISNYATSRAPGSESLFSMRTSAENFMRTGVSAALNAYPAALTKYRALITSCTSLKIVGLTDRAIPLPPEGPSGIVQTRLMAGGDPCYATNSDLSTMIVSGTHPDFMAENFAIAEVLLTQGLSNSITLATEGVSGLNYQNVRNWGDKSARSVDGGHYFDEHDTGAWSSLIINSFMYQCMSSCMHELFQVLRNRNLFNDTVFFVTSDFGRNIRSEATGTDHDETACNFSIFNGNIKGPVALGNIQRTSSAGGGYWHGDSGQYRDVNNLFGSNRPVHIHDAVSTVAALARIQSPAENNPSLVGPDGTPLIERARETG